MNKRLLCLCLIVIIIVISVTSCKSDDLLKTDSEHLLLLACVYYSVPGFYQSELKDSNVNVIETDDFGRTLVSFEGDNWLTDKFECVYVICQKYNDSTIYFYEDINYIWMNDSTTDLDNFKKHNDWNNNIDESKLSNREIRVSLDLCLVKDSPFSDFSDKKFYASLEEDCDINQEEILSVKYSDWDGEKHAMYLITLNSGDKYFCIVDTDYNTYTDKIENAYDFVEIIQELKHESNWHYSH